MASPLSPTPVSRWGEAWLPALALLLPAALCFALERFEPVQLGAYAKMELYTRLAAEGAQRVGPESRFQVHQPGPSFFYAAAPVYVLFGEDTRAMAAAALVWNGAFLLLFVRQASRLAPGIGPVAAAVALGALLWARGPDLLMSWFNIHVALLPFGVALLASARVATGDSRALPVLMLAASVVLQCQVAWLPGVAVPASAGIVLLLWPAARAALRIPACGPGLTRGTVAATALVALALWSLPVVDELTGDYRNLHRMFAIGEDRRMPTPWLDTLGPSSQALRLARDHPAADALEVPDEPRARLRLALVAAAGLLGGWLAVRRRAPASALAFETGVALFAVATAFRYVPGRRFPAYLFEWASLVTVAALLGAATEILLRLTNRLPAKLLAGVTLALVGTLLAGKAIARQASAAIERDPLSLAIEDVTREVQARVKELPPGRRFLVRVDRREDRDTRNQAIVTGLILALDKTGLRFGVEPFGSCRLEGHFAPRGDEWAELLVGRLPAREGAVPLGAPGGIGVVWQRVLALQAAPRE